MPFYFWNINHLLVAKLALPQISTETKTGTRMCVAFLVDRIAISSFVHCNVLTLLISTIVQQLRGDEWGMIRLRCTIDQKPDFFLSAKHRDKVFLMSNLSHDIMSN